MDPDRWARVESLFHRALGLPRSERDAWLREQCAGDDDLCAEVARLIAADTGAHVLVDQLESGALHAREDPLIGREIGAYRLTKRIGAGGMGLVYEAERTDGLFRHQVAIKLIRVELATETLVQRFELERRTLAGLHHPNIAQLHDGGATPDGRPYLVMELVRGRPIDRYCDEHELSVEDRLRLFVQVCRGVHYAHQNLVVHRDLKPGNVLVDESGVPKLLDFGIARLLDETAVDAGISPTLTMGQILTPDYASPEQLTLGPVTTAMDVYSLGVVMYELLTGRRPFKSENKSPVEWHRDVLERAPTRPSSVVTTVDLGTPPSPSAQVSPQKLAALRAASPRGLQRRLRGDIDRIVLVALRKEPQRRYASAKDLADDIERHLTGHPVQARGDSFAYRASTFVRRNRIAVGSALAVVVALVAGIVFAVRGEQDARAQAVLARAAEGRAEEQAQVARAAENHANEEAERAHREEQRAQEQALHARVEAQSFQSIAEYLMDTFLTSIPGMDKEQLDQKRHRIDMHAAQLRREYADQDHLRANLLDSLGRVAQRLGLTDEAKQLIEEALGIRKRAFGEDSLEYALSLRSLGTLLYQRGEPGPAADVLKEALALHRKHSAETHTDIALVANDLAACLRGIGRLDEAEKLHLEALELRRKDKDGSLPVAESLNNLAGIDLDRNNLSAAAVKLEEALAIRRRLIGDEDPLTLQAMSNLASTYWHLGRKPEAYALLDEAEKGSRALQADGEVDLAQILSNRSAMVIAENDLARAAPMIDEALELQVRHLGPHHPSVASTMTRRAFLQAALHHPDEARKSWQDVLTIRRAPGVSPRLLTRSLKDYGEFLLDEKDWQSARAAFEEALSVLRSTGSDQTDLLARTQLGMGRAALGMKDTAGAREHFEAALSIAAGQKGLAEVEKVAKEGLVRCDEAHK